MDKRVLRERMRRKKRQMMIRHYTKIGLCVIGMILAVVFVVRGMIIPIAHHVAGGGSSDQTVQAQADTEEVQANSDAAVRQPLKGKSDTDKVAAMDGATKAAPPAAESAHVKTQDSPDTAEPPVEEDVALGGHSDRDHGVISRQPLGPPTLSKPMSRKSSNRLSSSPLHGSAASPILASRW